MLPWLHLPLNEHLRYLDIYIYTFIVEKNSRNKNNILESNKKQSEKKYIEQKYTNQNFGTIYNLSFFFGAKAPPSLFYRFRSSRITIVASAASIRPSCRLLGFLPRFNAIPKGEALGFQPSILRCHVSLREGRIFAKYGYFSGFWVAIFRETTWNNQNRCLFSLLHIECELPKCRPVHSTMCCSNIFGNSHYKLPTITTTTGNFTPRDGTIFRKKVK